MRPIHTSSNDSASSVPLVTEPLAVVVPKWLTVRVGFAASWSLALALVVVETLAAVSDGSLRESFFISDHLYIAALVEDLWHWHGDSSDWRFTPAPYFFPDVPLYAVFRCCGLSLEWAQYLGCLAHWMLVTWTARALIRAVVPGARAASNLVGLFSVVWLIAYLRNWLPLVEPLLIISNHGGAAWAALAILALILKPREHRPSVWVGLAVGLAFCVGVSDPLLAASCGAALLPMATLAAGLRIWRMDALRPSALACVACAGASLAGARVTDLVHAQTSGLVNGPKPDLRAHALRQLADDLLGPAWLVGSLLGLACLLAIGMLVQFRSRPHAARLRWFGLWQLASSAATLGALAWAGNYDGVGSLRYVMVPFTTALVLPCAWLVEMLQARSLQFQRRTGVVCAASATAWLFADFIADGAHLVHGQYQSRMRASAACVQRIAQASHVDVVLTEYWKAKPLMLFSDGQVRALQMSPGLGNPYWWINSRGWYRGPHNFGVIVSNDLFPEEITERYGPPERVERCDDLELFTYAGKGRARLQHAMQKRFARFTREH